MSKLHTHCKLGLVGATLLAGTLQSSAEVESIFGAAGISGEISAGYDSKYFYRGLFFGDDNLWSGVEFSKEICDSVSLSVGAYYLDVLADDDNPTPPNGAPFRYSESGISTTLSWDSGAGVFDLGLTHFQFYDGFDGDGVGQQDATELSLTYSTDIAYGMEGYLQAVYDMRINAWYLEAGVSKSFSINEFVSFDLAAAVGYSVNEYYTTAPDDGEGITHTLLSASLPIALRDNVTLTPHISVNFSGDARENTNIGLGQDRNQVFGGINLAVGF